ncbi:MAG: D-alanyl-D-alanine carboxypeptidase [Bacteroidales bacterium]|nr:D-alanyl-D-alanine carboxypeptidase [Bacteroidales bacterium]MCM1414325.1 D-alanyl-D-alanine carboxypeptidase [bacterium]MCM1422205.1 D-alanyl-D-alanine carboxypeptidase [bacterium]
MRVLKSGRVERPKKRQWKRNYYRVAAIVLAAALFCCPIRSIYAEEKEKDDLQLYAQAAVLMDADSGRVLYGKNEKDVLPMASTTKIMTCILALEYGDPEQIVEASAYAAGMPKVKLYVKSGEKYRLGDLLYSLMLESHNDAAVVIAEGVGGSVERFASMMNQKARDIGCYDSYFITPNGLDATVNETGKIHSTTAADLAKIMAYCVTDSPKKEEFLEITRTLGYDFTDADGTRSFHCDNHNAFLGMMEEALSGKTGFTNQAGYCYVGALESEGRIFTVALLACGWPNNRSYKWSDMKKLAAYGMEHYRYRDIYEEKDFADIPVRGGIAGEDGTPWEEAFVGVSMEEREKSLPYLLCEEDQVEVRTRVETVLAAPVAAGEKAGEVSYYLNGELVRRYDVLTESAVEAQSFLWILEYLVKLAIFF